MRWGFFDAQLCRCSLAASLLIQGCNHIHTGLNAPSSAVQAQIIVICLPPLSAGVQLIEFLTLLIFVVEALDDGSGTLDAAGTIRILRDPTRGGVATTLNEFTEGLPFSIEIDQSSLPIDPSVEAACDMLGLDPLYCACEGRMLAVCAPQDAEAILESIRRTPGGENAARIGTVTEEMPGKVLLRTPIGGRRILPKLTGLQLPRIC